FQAEDGIRDGHVTGVQTCALPISRRRSCPKRSRILGQPKIDLRDRQVWPALLQLQHLVDEGLEQPAVAVAQAGHLLRQSRSRLRSEERRVGKECRARWQAGRDTRT